MTCHISSDFFAIASYLPTTNTLAAKVMLLSRLYVSILDHLFTPLVHDLLRLVVILSGHGHVPEACATY